VAEGVFEGKAVSEITVAIDVPTVREERPVIRWQFTQGGARELSLAVAPDAPGAPVRGVRSKAGLVVPPGATLALTAVENGRLSVALGATELAGEFTNLDGSAPAILPEVPVGRSRWSFRAASGLFDASLFDDVNTFDLPVFEVEVSWLRYVPLTFDVHVPYFLQQAVAELAAFHRYPGSLFVFEGLPVEALADVVNQTRAAGVRGSVQFSLNFLDVHEQGERFVAAGQHTVSENATAFESLTATSVNDTDERHDVAEILVIGGVWDVSTFDQGHGWLE
jgi:hypothetical protein